MQPRLRRFMKANGSIDLHLLQRCVGIMLHGFSNAILPLITMLCGTYAFRMDMHLSTAYQPP